MGLCPAVGDVDTKLNVYVQSTICHTTLLEGFRDCLIGYPRRPDFRQHQHESLSVDTLAMFLLLWSYALCGKLLIWSSDCNRPVVSGGERNWWICFSWQNCSMSRSKRLLWPSVIMTTGRLWLKIKILDRTIDKWFKSILIYLDVSSNSNYS